MRKWNFLLLLLVGSLAGCGTCQNQVSPVTIKYQEPMQFTSAEPNANFGIASYFKITCIDNRGPSAVDFTFDVAKVFYSDIGDTKRFTPVTSSIPAGPPAQNWKHSALVASTYLVPKGQVKSFSEPYPFVIIWSGRTFEQEAGNQHRLSYDATPPQAVQMFNRTKGDVEYRNIVTAADLFAGRWSNRPAVSESCP